MFASMLKVENFKWDMVRTHKSSVFRITSLDKFFVLIRKGAEETWVLESIIPSGNLLCL